jgi:hypothetical protein
MRVADIATAALLVDSATAAWVYKTGVGGQRIREWYRTLRIGAYAMDVLSLVIGAYVAMRIAPDSLWLQIAAVVAVQLTHDIAFGAFVRSRAAKGPLMRLFRDYADENGAHILWVDALMLVLTIAVARAVSRWLSVDAAAAAAAVAAYAGLLVVYSF